MKSKVEIYTDKSGEWRWRMKASNGRIVATGGEGFKRHSSCRASLYNVWGTFSDDDFDVVDEKENAS